METVKFYEILGNFEKLIKSSLEALQNKKLLNRNFERFTKNLDSRTSQSKKLLLHSEAQAKSLKCVM
jgi:hypothetical protein